MEVTLRTETEAKLIELARCTHRGTDELLEEAVENLVTNGVHGGQDRGTILKDLESGGGNEGDRGLETGLETEADETRLQLRCLEVPPDRI